MRRWTKNTFIYYLTRVTINLFGLVPTRLVTHIGRWLGALAYSVARRERLLARQNLAAALGIEIDSPRAHLLARGVFFELGVSAIELCRVHRSRNTVPQIVIPEASRQALDRALAEDKGVIFVTGHIGNWELMALTLAGLGYPISTVAKESYDSRFTRLIDRFRKRSGVEAIYRGQPGASAAMLRTLRKNRVLGFLIDQDTRVPGTFVPFFGRLAHTPVGPAVFALRSGAPVVVGSIRRTVNGCHIVEITRCLIPEDVDAATAELTRQLESRIRRHPSQWVWFHRRWKTQPSKENAA
ncbi:MAG: lysophospholipid acyltransferase family protein [Deltaproteobacteria bacterium]|nr:lysophospholipid acyltransferase family protein [Deltaproteobacteria bacterium]